MEFVTLSDLNIGNLEMDTTQGGTAVAKFSVADNKSDRDGNEFTVWHNCKVYGSTAEYLQRNNAKGRRVSLAGEKTYWQYQGEQYDVIDVATIRFVDSKSKGNGQQQGGGQQYQGNTQGQQQQQPATQPAGGGGGNEFEPDEDLPF